MQPSASNALHAIYLPSKKPYGGRPRLQDVGAPINPQGSHPGEIGPSGCTFAERKEEGIGQAAEVGLLDRLLAREGA
jgi:hypothetical protein